MNGVKQSLDRRLGDFQRLGGHWFRIERSGGELAADGDIFHWLIVGQVELADIKQVLDIVQAVDVRHRHVFMIIELVGSGGFAPEGRRYYLDWRRQHVTENRWVYVIGASGLARALIMLVLRGTKLVTGREPVLYLVRDEVEARTLIAEARVRHGL